MPLDLFRIDERLLHGQVIAGWGMRLDIDFYVVVDDDVARNPWEADLYAAGLPSGVEAEFVSVEDAIAGFARFDSRAGRGALLTRSPDSMRALAEAGLLDGRRVNLGGLHAGDERRRVLPYLHLASRDVADLEVIAMHAGSVTARDLPAAREVPLQELLRAAR